VRPHEIDLSRPHAIDIKYTSLSENRYYNDLPYLKAEILVQKTPNFFASENIMTRQLHNTVHVTSFICGFFTYNIVLAIYVYTFALYCVSMAP